ncbi:MAG: hypothetical protein A2W26_01475 [Acidobacteria bacterium RBG_16_64_8]|nr:MAG: hypothetical protein A2W26_01475 [Acidobacteria bacterium RBG_16_64_8]
MATKAHFSSAHTYPSTRGNGATALAIELSELQAHIRTLITLEETEAPVLSCYVNRDLTDNGHGPILDHGAWTLRKTLRREEREPFEQALERITTFLGRELSSTTQGVAAFSRAGAHPYFLGLQFQVPVVDWLSIDSTPNIYHLVELKDTYHRYVVMISTAESARILEVNLGAITRELWTERPELRERVGREWTREHYQAHRRDRGERFLREKVAILDRLMSAGGHTHLILAGTPEITARVRGKLPKHLAAKLIDMVPASSSARTVDVVGATLSNFVAREQQESLRAVMQLVSHLRRGGLAVVGTPSTLEALERNQVDVLVMAKTYQPPRGLACKSCDRIDTTTDRPTKCLRCGSTDLRPVNVKETIVKQAERIGAEVEIVEHADVLMALGGVGCLLRYLTPEQAR